MQFDLGFWGLALLIGLSLAFGAIAHFVLRGRTSWMWLIAATAWFIGGLIASEVVFATATSAELQPIIDGLAFDEALLGGLLGGSLGAIVTRALVGGRTSQAATEA